MAKVKPYRSVSLKFLSVELDISIEEVRSLLSELILEEKIKGEIDQQNGFLELQQAQKSQKHIAMQNWQSRSPASTAL